MIRRPPRSPRTDPLFPYTTLFRSLHWSRFRAGGQEVHATARTPLQRVCGARLAFCDGKHMSRPTRMRLKRIWRPFVRGTHSSNLSRSEEHTSELQSLMRISYAVFWLKKKKSKSNMIQESTLR